MVVLKLKSKYYSTDGVEINSPPAKSIVISLDLDKTVGEGEYHISDHIIPGFYEFECQDGLILFRLDDGIYTSRLVDQNERNLICLALAESPERLSQKDFSRIERGIKDLEKARRRKEIFKDKGMINRMTIIILIFTILFSLSSYLVEAEGIRADKRTKGYAAKFYRDLDQLIKTRAGTIIEQINNNVFLRLTDTMSLTIISQLASYNYDVKDGTLKVTMKQAEVDLKSIIGEYWKVEQSSDGQFITIYP